ncbi:hypothetical protein HYV43_03090 [Candidatus Micrarchaeota archaeon]|nr:hypothetical protein [Candidatus Micrarchaeota archaeon]
MQYIENRVVTGLYGMQRQVMCAGAACGPSEYAHALAQWAKVELLKEKVKARIDQKHGAQLDALADLIVEVVTERAQGAESLERQEEKLAEAWDRIDGCEATFSFFSFPLARGGITN